MYLPISIYGRSALALLDSGSQLSLIPQKLVRPRELRRSEQTLLAANLSEITVVGEVLLPCSLGDRIVPTKFLVSPQIDEVILGMAWLQEQEAHWNFQDSRIQLLGRTYGVQRKEGAPRCRKIATTCDVKVPPLSEINVDVYAVLPNLNVNKSQWATQPTVLDTGLIVAGTLLPDRTRDLTVRIMNPTNKTIQLKEGSRCELEEVSVLESRVSAPSTPGDSRVKTGSLEEVETVLSPLWTNVAEDVPEECQNRLRGLLMKYRAAFSLNEWDLGYTDLVQHVIETGQELPVRQALRRQPLVLLPVIDEQVESMLAQGLIEPSVSPWSSNVVMVQKRDGTPRFCVDYRALNQKTQKDAFPLPLISECLDTLGGARWFSTFDLRAGYHQVAVHPGSRHKTAFVTRKGSFQFKVLPFGLTNSPGCFSRMMNLVMSGLNFITCLVYLDDIIVFATDLETHLLRLEQILGRLAAVNLKLKPSKCHLLQSKVLFLGHVISAEGVATDPEKIEAVESWPTPSKLKELRAFLGLCSYYRKFVPEFARIARPLHDMTRKGVPFVWTKECEEAFRKLKQTLTEAPILSLPDDQGMFILDTDASGEALGGVLSQVQDNQEKVICYGSRVCSLAERNYDVTKRELLAIVHFLKVYRPYLLGRRFLLRTDHSALQWLRKTPLPIGQQARWLTFIEEFIFDVAHRPGTAHLNADALSRRPQLVRAVGRLRGEPSVTPNLPAAWTVEEMAEEQRADPDLRWIIQRKLATETGPSPEELRGLSPVIKTLAAQWPQLEVRDGLLTRNWLAAEDNGVLRKQLIPSPCRRATIINLCHEGITGGHLGIRRTSAQVQRRAYWPGWREDVKLQLLRCIPCARYLRGKPPHQGYLQNMVVGAPSECIALDLTGPHVPSRRGHRYILTVIDHFSRFAEAFPVRNQEALTVARVLVDQWIARFGCPLQILSDQGPCFEAALFQDLCRLLQIDKIRTSPYKPSTNGMIERFHRTLNAMIGKAVAENQRDWDERLPSIMAAYRASIHESTGFTPNKLFLAREICAPIDLVLGDCFVREEPVACNEFVYETGKRLQSAYTLARECMQTHAETRAFRYDMRVRPKTFQIGQFVWYFYPRHRQLRKDKWCSFYVGPFKIVEILGSVLYKIQRTPRAQPKLVYVDKLKLYTGDVPEAWGESGAVAVPEGDLDLGNLEAGFGEDPDPDEDVCPVIRPKRSSRAPLRFGFDEYDD